MRAVRILATQSTKMDCPDDLIDDTFHDHHRNPHDCGPEEPGRREQHSNDHERPNSSKQVGTHRRRVYSKMVFDGSVPVLRFPCHCDLIPPSAAETLPLLPECYHRSDQSRDSSPRIQSDDLFDADLGGVFRDFLAEVTRERSPVPLGDPCAEQLPVKINESDEWIDSLNHARGVLLNSFYPGAAGRRGAAFGSFVVDAQFAFGVSNHHLI